MRVLVCGDRNYGHQWAVWEELDDLLEEGDRVVVIEGGAKGADRMAAEWVDHYDGEPASTRITHHRFPADWGRYGRGAGPKRNQQMLDEGCPDLVLAFHDDFENSKGTRDMVRRAERAGIPVRLCVAAGGV